MLTSIKKCCKLNISFSWYRHSTNNVLSHSQPLLFIWNIHKCVNRHNLKSAALSFSLYQLYNYISAKLWCTITFTATIVQPKQSQIEINQVVNQLMIHQKRWYSKKTYKCIPSKIALLFFYGSNCKSGNFRGEKFMFLKFWVICLLILFTI